MNIVKLGALWALVALCFGGFALAQEEFDISEGASDALDADDIEAMFDGAADEWYGWKYYYNNQWWDCYRNEGGSWWFYDGGNRIGQCRSSESTGYNYFLGYNYWDSGRSQYYWCTSYSYQWGQCAPGGTSGGGYGVAQDWSPWKYYYNGAWYDCYRNEGGSWWYYDGNSRIGQCRSYESTGYNYYNGYWYWDYNRSKYYWCNGYWYQWGQYQYERSQCGPSGYNYGSGGDGGGYGNNGGGGGGYRALRAAPEGLML